MNGGTAGCPLAMLGLGDPKWPQMVRLIGFFFALKTTFSTPTWSDQKLLEGWDNPMTLPLLIESDVDIIAKIGANWKSQSLWYTICAISTCGWCRFVLNMVEFHQWCTALNFSVRSRAHATHFMRLGCRVQTQDTKRADRVQPATLNLVGQRDV